jgi:hypothetical protein
MRPAMGGENRPQAPPQLRLPVEFRCQLSTSAAASQPGSRLEPGGAVGDGLRPRLLSAGRSACARAMSRSSRFGRFNFVNGVMSPERPVMTRMRRQRLTRSYSTAGPGRPQLRRPLTDSAPPACVPRP